MLGSASALGDEGKTLCLDISPGFPVREENWHVAEAAFEKLIREKSRGAVRVKPVIGSRLYWVKTFQSGLCSQAGFPRPLYYFRNCFFVFRVRGWRRSWLLCCQPIILLISQGSPPTHTLPRLLPESPRGSPWLLTWAGEPASTTQKKQHVQAAGAMVTNIMKIASWLTDKRDSTGAAAVFFIDELLKRKKKEKKVDIDLLGVTDNGDKTYLRILCEFCISFFELWQGGGYVSAGRENTVGWLLVRG